MNTATLSARARTSFRIQPLSAPLGAEVIGLDLSRPLSDGDFLRLHEAHLAHHVLVFRDVHITPAEQVRFSARWGRLQRHVLHQFALPGQPEVLVVSNIVENGRPIGLGDAGVYWHSDLSYKQQPSLGSFLHAQELPATGGDTLFANQHLAWDQLPRALKDDVAGLWAEHSYLKKYAELQKRSPWRPDLNAQQLAQVTPVAHPVVRTHPETGERALFVNPGFTKHVVELEAAESEALLAFLYAHSTKPEFTVRYHWAAGDVAFWDNRATQHAVVGDFGDAHRVIQRVTLRGDEPRA
jgi:taurine dioxygenase